MKIGIISDTHSKLGRAKKILQIFKEQQCEHIIHAGDIVKIEVLEKMEELGIPYTAILGNNDNHLIDKMDLFNLHKEPYYFQLDDLKIKLMHTPYYLLPEDCDIVIYGHTHTMVCEYNSGALFLNSGEACARDRNRSQAFILETNLEQYTLHQYNREIGRDKWDIEKKIINRI